MGKMYENKKANRMQGEYQAYQAVGRENLIDGI
jgi:hypothetical protein